jgi:H+/gluconate symporter-like permease
MAQPHHSAYVDPHDHGSTPAAWTMVVIITLASIVSTLGVMLANWPMFWVGIGLVGVGVVVGKVMQRTGAKTQ